MTILINTTNRILVNFLRWAISEKPIDLIHTSDIKKAYDFAQNNSCIALFVDMDSLTEDELLTLKKMNRQSSVQTIIHVNHTKAKEENISNNTENKIYIRDHIIFDKENFSLYVNDKLIPLTSIEFKLLNVLNRKAGFLVTIDELINEVWGHDFAMGSSSLYVHIHQLRKKIEDNPSNPQIIVTCRGLGYKLETI